MPVARHRQRHPHSADCCADTSSQHNTEPAPLPAGEVQEPDCCGSSRQFDWLFWGSAIICATALLVAIIPAPMPLPEWTHHMSHAIAGLLSKMWWGLLLGVAAVGLLNRVPRTLVISALGTQRGPAGILRAIAGGLIFDLCNHGILLVGMSLYKRGATPGQTFAFLLASPWNSLSLTLILTGLIGLPWTLAIVAGSATVALAVGLITDALVAARVLPANSNRTELPEGYRFWPAFGQAVRAAKFSPQNILAVMSGGLGESRMILRWILFGTVLAAAVQTFVPATVFREWFGPTLLGLGLTLIAATIIEVCSEGSTPLAAELYTRAGAPGNAFAFLMAGAATDFTEIIALRETTRRWIMALALPILSIPQILLIGALFNGLHAHRIV